MRKFIVNNLNESSQEIECDNVEFGGGGVRFLKDGLYILVINNSRWSTIQEIKVTGTEEPNFNSLFRGTSGGPDTKPGAFG